MASPIDCNKEFDKLPNLRSPRVRDATMLIRNFDKSVTAKVLANMSSGNCDMSKVYRIEFSCNKLLKFLSSSNGEIVEVISQPYRLRES